MGIKTLMVELAVGESNQNQLRVASDLSQRLHASVIGVAAAQPMSLAFGNGYYAGEVIQDDRDELVAELAAAEAEFRTVFPDTSDVANSPQWHAATVYQTVADFVSGYACEADLILTTGASPDHPANRCSRTADLLMQVGRPVLLLPRGLACLSLKHALIAWKDTRETRRAVADALPLLKMSDQVVLAQLVHAEELDQARAQLESVARWLRSHRVNCESITLASVGDDAQSLNSLIEERGIDLVVAGAYGHSRFREWVLGGVTRDLLLHESHCSLLSH